MNGRRALIVGGLGAATWAMARTPRLGRARVDAGDITVVVPARNEARNLPGLLGDLAAQEDPPGAVIVVDDGSTDDTAAVARTFGVEVVTAPEPPPGWTGKAWACHQGAQHVRTGRIAFVDADVRFAPDSLGRLAAAHDVGLLSVQPHARTEAVYEQLSLFFNVVAVMGVGVCAAVPPRTPGGAFGAFLLTTRREYDTIGGHAAVASDVIEDLAFARRYAARNLPVRVLLGGDDVQFRMYPEGPAQLVEGWTKNFGAAATSARPVDAALTSLWIAACTAVALNALAAVRRRRGGRGAALGYAAVAAQLAWTAGRVGRFRPWAIALWPAPLAAFLAVFTRSLVRSFGRGSVEWRGRTVAVQRVRS